jgi:hypothetical protein
MSGQFEHELLPQATHDELARQSFVHSLKVHLASHVSPGNKKVYEQRVKPRSERESGRPPKDRHEVRRFMTSEPYYQMWSALQRTSQEMMWDSVSTSVERQFCDLANKAAQAERKKIGGWNPRAASPASTALTSRSVALPHPQYPHENTVTVIFGPCSARESASLREA